MATWEVASNGVIDAPSSYSAVVIATAPDLASAVVTQDMIATAAGATGTGQTLSANLDTTGLAGGVYYVAAVADDGNGIDESDEADNLTEWIVITVAEPAYNLALNDVAVAAATSDFDLNGGASLDLTATVSNTGNSDSGAFTVTTVLSADAIWSADDLEISSFGGVAQPGETVQVGGLAVVDADWPAGDYYVISYVEWGATGEPDTTDNLLVSAETVTFVGGTTYGTPGPDTFAGTDADETFDLGAGNDMVTGSAGDDVILGGDGIDTVDYSGFASPIGVYPDAPGVSYVDKTPYDYNTSPHDYLDAVEVLIATEYDDEIAIVDGSVREIATLGGNDAVIGSVGDDLIETGAGDDLIGGIAGDDFIFTGSGYDMVYVDRETDGGSPAGDGHDVVADFDPLTDVLLVEFDVHNEVYDPFADLTQTAEGALLSYAPESSVLLLGVDLADLNSANLQTYQEILIYY